MVVPGGPNPRTIVGTLVLSWGTIRGDDEVVGVGSDHTSIETGIEGTVGREEVERFLSRLGSHDGATTVVGRGAYTTGSIKITVPVLGQ